MNCICVQEREGGRRGVVYFAEAPSGSTQSSSLEADQGCILSAPHSSSWMFSADKLSASKTKRAEIKLLKSSVGSFSSSFFSLSRWRGLSGRRSSLIAVSALTEKICMCALHVLPSMCAHIYTCLTSTVFSPALYESEALGQRCSAHSAHFHDGVSVTDYVFVHVWTLLCWGIYIPLYMPAYTLCVFDYEAFSLFFCLFCVKTFFVFVSLFLPTWALCVLRVFNSSQMCRVWRFLGSLKISTAPSKVWWLHEVQTVRQCLIFLFWATKKTKHKDATWQKGKAEDPACFFYVILFYKTIIKGFSAKALKQPYYCLTFTFPFIPQNSNKRLHTWLKIELFHFWQQYTV